MNRQEQFEKYRGAKWREAAHWRKVETLAVRNGIAVELGTCGDSPTDIWCVQFAGGGVYFVREDEARAYAAGRGWLPVECSRAQPPTDCAEVWRHRRTCNSRTTYLLYSPAQRRYYIKRAVWLYPFPSVETAWAFCWGRGWVAHQVTDPEELKWVKQKIKEVAKA